jgi:hypothetical protein
VLEGVVHAVVELNEFGFQKTRPELRDKKIRMRNTSKNRNRMRIHAYPE